MTSIKLFHTIPKLIYTKLDELSYKKNSESQSNLQCIVMYKRENKITMSRGVIIGVIAFHVHPKYITVKTYYGQKNTIGLLLYNLEVYAKKLRLQCVRLFTNNKEDIYEIAKSRNYFEIPYDNGEILCFKYIPTSAL
jgi:hypothetical protein